MKQIKYMFLAMLLGAIPFLANAQESSAGTIKGKVIRQTTKQPVAGATITVGNGQYGTTSDSAGIFMIKDIPAGAYPLNISRIGFQKKTISEVEVTANKTYYTEIELIEESYNLDKITVKSFKGENDKKIPVSTYSYSREEIFRNPGAQGDIFRAIGILPGVVSSGAQYSAIAVRGQGTQDNVFMVDDMPMYNLSHLEIEGFNSGFNDPNGGRFSLFAPRVINSAQFQSGGFDAGYGRKGSSFLSLGIKEGNLETSSLSGQFDLLGFTMIYDGKSGFSKKTSLFASARYQNFALLEQMIGLSSAGLPSFGDYILKTTTEINKKNKLSFVAMYNPEKYTRTIGNLIDGKNLNNDNSASFVGKSVTSKAIFGLNLRTLTSSTSYWRNVLYFRISRVSNTLGAGYPAVDSTGEILKTSGVAYETDLRNIRNNQSEIGYRSIYNRNYKNLTLRAGIDLAEINLDYSRQLKHADTLYTFYPSDYRPDPTQNYLVLSPYQFNADIKKSAFNASGYITLSWQLSQRLTLNPGLRYDYTGFAEQHTLSPRLSGSFSLTDKQSINFASGIYYQDAAYSDVAGQSSAFKLTSERTIQHILGYKNQFSPDVKLVVEGYYKQLHNLVVQPYTGRGYLTNNGTGYAFGGDVSLTKRLSRKYYGQVSYSYMESKRDDHNGFGQYNYIFSQPHTISLLGSFKPNNKWVFSGKFRYATGRPTDKFIVHSNVLNNAAYLRYSQEIVAKNGNRLNDFISLDLRADYKVQLRKTSATVFVDIVDVLNRFNQNAAIFQSLTGGVYHLGLAIFPSFGLRLEI